MVAEIAAALLFLFIGFLIAFHDVCRGYWAKESKNLRYMQEVTRHIWRMYSLNVPIIYTPTRKKSDKV